jgi:hypothetical protein
MLALNGHDGMPGQSPLCDYKQTSPSVGRTLQSYCRKSERLGQQVDGACLGLAGQFSRGHRLTSRRASALEGGGAQIFGAPFFRTGGTGSYRKSSIFLKGKAHLVKGAQVAGHLAETSGHLVRERRFLRQDPLIMALSGGSAELPMTLKKAAAPCRPSRCPRYAQHHSCRYDDCVY